MIRRLLSHPDCPPLDETAVRSYLCAALLHDLGHFPFTHSLKELPLAGHEELAARAILDGPLRESLSREVGADSRMVAAIIDESLPDQSDPALRFFRTLLSGALDPDKLDYLCRDAYFCGVPYGVQDIEFAISRIIPNGAGGIALEKTGISAVENVLFSKYLMYRAVYWHRTVRVATAMIKKGLFEGLKSGLIAPEDLYGLNDETFFAGFATRAEAPFQLIQRVHNRRLHVPVSDMAFDEDDPVHRELLVLSRRAETEEQIAATIREEIGTEIGVGDVILDVPESISFEVTFPVLDGSDFIDSPKPAPSSHRALSVTSRGISGVSD
jgi:HD superfamily phosphohydrolase